MKQKTCVFNVQHAAFIYNLGILESQSLLETESMRFSIILAAVILTLLLPDVSSKGVDRTTTMHKGQIEELARVMREAVRDDLTKSLMVLS